MICRIDPGIATFDPFTEGGRFASGFLAPEYRLRALARPRRRAARIRRPVSAAGERTTRAIKKASRVAAARRWLPCNALLVHAMRAEDAIRRRRPEP